LIHFYKRIEVKSVASNNGKLVGCLTVAGAQTGTIDFTSECNRHFEDSFMPANGSWVYSTS